MTFLIAFVTFFQGLKIPYSLVWWSEGNALCNQKKLNVKTFPLVGTNWALQSCTPQKCHLGVRRLQPYGHFNRLCLNNMVYGLLNSLWISFTFWTRSQKGMHQSKKARRKTWPLSGANRTHQSCYPTWCRRSRTRRHSQGVKCGIFS